MHKFLIKLFLLSHIAIIVSGNLLSVRPLYSFPGVRTDSCGTYKTDWATDRVMTRYFNS